MPEKTEVKQESKKLVAFAPFEYGERSYKAGDVFIPPASFVRDLGLEEFRGMSRKGGGQKGMAFTTEGKRIILPLKES